ncbi:NADPH-dependent FMN reductase [Bosea thiooxidans]|uniref:NAD(P)H-dependent FMN reductase n=1 Tax=Bosea thiooxidans TaxID=53254 RepID=A0A0Q3I268_9HYPH|nr:NADPH-dependent FMN reductase [Bosea thiooxidans]KQK29063.1 NADPH-dependent FMN reductase [Bosea thiooxidans]SKB76329.1 NAD(P)H-dependent FMN reductase [Bosea thiooxidans]
MTRLLGISGSLRKASFNTGLLRAAIDLTPDGATLQAGSIEGIPLYNGDDEREQGVPASVQALKRQLAEAEGLLLFTPEYNNSLPGVFKNAIDWLTRPASDIKPLFGGKPVAVLGASPGGFGTILAQDAWLPVLRTLGTKPWFEGRMLVSRAQSVFDADGNLVDDATRQRLGQFLAGFAAFVASR